ncbi:TPA: ABC-2 transporter permease [Staphylococcus aureus]|nr:ABC-2 transporter permease [Staphylococcus aureus]HCV9227346.1 ABC-2 transporter permease [Staphylococcus aureus]HCW0112444.1 ABC-2 transporter permease [Staphylococcus aureus]
MKGMFLSSFYATRKQTYIYFIVAIIAAGYFAVFNPLMSSAMAGVMLITPITDNIKHEKDSRWMYYVSTLPVKRSDYIKSYFAFYLILFGASLMIGLVVTQSVMIGIMSGLMSFGIIGAYSIIFPLTFKFGAENSNVIMICASILLLISFVVFFFIYGMVSGASALEFEKISTGGWLVVIVYAVIGIVITSVSYILSIKIFNKQEL